MFQQTRPVPETPFGTGFQQTDVWRRYVVARALDDLEALLRQAGGPERFDRVLDAGCGAGAPERSTCARTTSRRARYPAPAST